MSPMPLLRCRGLEAGYGLSQVLFGLDFDIQPGEVVALLGRNGAGATFFPCACRAFLARQESRLAAVLHSRSGPAGACGPPRPHAVLSSPIPRFPGEP